MISYEPLWKTMKEQGITPYALRYKHNLGGGTIQRLKANKTVSTNTLDILCKVLNCQLHQVAKYIDDSQLNK